jgi:hypothetical protein
MYKAVVLRVFVRPPITTRNLANPKTFTHLFRQLGLVTSHHLCLSQQRQLLHRHAVRCRGQAGGQGGEEGTEGVLVTTSQQSQGPGSRDLWQTQGQTQGQTQQRTQQQVHQAVH